MTTDRYAEVSYYDKLADGTPCWLEIATPEPDATMRFYGSVFDWEFESRRGSAGSSYTVATLSGEPVCGIVTSDGPILDWTLYLATSHMNWARGEAVRFGGAILGRTQQLPGVGINVLLDEASGSTVGLCQPAEDWTFGTGMPGTLVWAELITRDAPLADRFFHRLFGFQQRQFGDGRAMDYMVWYAGEESVIGRVRMAENTPKRVRSCWVAHFEVDPKMGFDNTLHAARMAGARLRFKPYHSSLGKVAVLGDPLGTRFAIIDPSLAATWDYSSGADDPYDD